MPDGDDFNGVALSGNGQRGFAWGWAAGVYSTRDGGEHWESHQEYGELSSLGDIALSDDGSVVLIAHQDKISVSRDNGKSKSEHKFGDNYYITDVHLSADGQHAIAFGGIVKGEDRYSFVSRDGGLNWKAVRSNVDGLFLSMSISADSQRAVAISSNNRIYFSIDGGLTWKRGVIQSGYVRYPAPWYYLALALCCSLLYRGMSGRPSNVPAGAAAIATSDAPADSLDQDRLEFAPLARGISRFLRNTETYPPLTLAITGEWGSGKSSLMGQVCDDLKSNGWRPVWFNAWHHQNEEQLLAALLTMVRDVGVPSWFSPTGLGFRLNLLLIRARRRMVVALLLVMLTTIVVSLLAQHPNVAEWHGLLTLFMALKSKDAATDVTALQSLLPLLGAIGVLVAIVHTMRAFGVDPAVLLSSTVARFKLKDASAQASFRMRFAEQFGDVTEALGAKHRMVIVIDDLDRCDPDTVRKVMEAVNFLTASGKCFVMFGMATSRVLAALALSFKDIASELVQFDNDGGDERQRRYDYARDYLEKLVNIEILVPKRTDIPPSRLLARDEAAVLAPLSAMIAEIIRWKLLLPIFAAIALGWWLASSTSLPKPPPAPAQGVESRSGSQQSLPPPQVTAPKDQAAVAKRVTRSNTSPVLVPGVDHGISPVWFLSALGLLTLFGVILFLSWLRRYALLVVDTEAFKRTLEIWTPVATLNRNSPRSIKRFGNRIRYLAMLQQVQELDEKPGWTRVIGLVMPYLDAILSKMGVRRRPQSPSPNDFARIENDSVLSEHLVVALGAIHAQFGDAWRNSILPFGDVGDANLKQLLDHAVAQYREIAGANWPPSEAQLNAFELSLKGVRLPGDPWTSVRDIKTTVPNDSARYKPTME